MPNESGAWTEKVLHHFHGTDGSGPDGSLIFDSAGNLYGTTAYGGAYNQGTVFKLEVGADGKWSETILHSFLGKDGAEPNGPLIMDATGSLYGTTYLGGTTDVLSELKDCDNTEGCGVAFKITP